MADDKDKKIEELAGRVMSTARDSCIIAMRFLDAPLSRIGISFKKNSGCAVCDGNSMTIDPAWLLRRCREERNFAVRLYLHVLMHWVFSQPFSYGRIEDKRHREFYSIAADIAVETVILELEIPGTSLSDDGRRREKIRVLRKYNEKITAPAIYRYFLTNDLSSEGEEELRELFCFDSHSAWKSESAEISLAEWQRLSERIKAELKSFSKNQNRSEGLSENLEEATRERYDYADILQHFSVMGESIQVNDEEFDYIYYTYGLTLYENMPLVEPLEYKDVRKIRDFVIVLDTSASCQGKTVRAFLSKTYSILKSQESFFSHINVHIVQCDNEVQSDVKITCDEDFEDFIRNGKLTGFGGTDYRPAFSYVEGLLERGEFENLKGLIYFTDGYGIYPEYMPEFDSMFVFLDEDDKRMDLPPWAIKVILSAQEIEDEA